MTHFDFWLAIPFQSSQNEILPRFHNINESVTSFEHVLRPQNYKAKCDPSKVRFRPLPTLVFHSTPPEISFIVRLIKKNLLITKLLFSLGSDRSVQRKFINLWCASQSNSVQRHDLAIFRSLRLAAQRWSTKKRRRKRKELERRFNVLPNRIFVSRSSNFTKFRRKFESCSFRTHPNVSFVSL